MMRKQLMTKKTLVWSLLGAMLSIAIFGGCTLDNLHGDDQAFNRTTISQGTSQQQGAEGTASEGGSESPGGESGGSGLELNEVAMLSPITPLDQTWKGNLGPLAIDARYDAATQSVISTVQNTTSQKAC